MKTLIAREEFFKPVWSGLASTQRECVREKGELKL